jgi:hypothetical protein
MSKKDNTSTWLLIGILALCVLLFVWLFLGTTIEEDSDPVTAPALLEQSQ